MRCQKSRYIFLNDVWEQNGFQSDVNYKTENVRKKGIFERTKVDYFNFWWKIKL